MDLKVRRVCVELVHCLPRERFQGLGLTVYGKNLGVPGFRVHPPCELRVHLSWSEAPL